MRYWDYIEERLPSGKIEWPDGARIAVVVSFDYQAEVGGGLWEFPDGTPNYGQLTEASYGGRVGIWRLLDILEKHQVKGSFATCGMTAEQYPESCRAIVELGHEIAGHTYTHQAQWTLSEDVEREQIQKTVAAIQEVTGERIVGWRCPLVQPSRSTLRLLVEEGFLWDGNFLNYDLPYMLDVDGGKLVEIPYTFATDDFPFIYGAAKHEVGGFPAPRNTMHDLFQMWKDEFDVLYEESEHSPRMFCFQSHPLVMGRAHRAKYFDMTLEYMKGHEGVWFATAREVAEWWLKNYDRATDTKGQLEALGFSSCRPEKYL